MPTEDSIRKAQKIFNDMTDPQNLIKGISYAKQLEEDFVRMIELQKLRENQKSKSNTIKSHRRDSSKNIFS